MPEHETHHQRSLEIQDGVFVPEAPDERSALRQRIDAEAAEAARAHRAGQASMPTDPNERRAQQTEGAGGGIPEAISATLPDAADQQTARHRDLGVGDFFDGHVIANEDQLRLARATQRTREESQARRAASQHPPTQIARNMQGAASARAALAAIPEFEYPEAPEPRPLPVIREGDPTPAALMQTGDEDRRQIPNSPS